MVSQVKPEITVPRLTRQVFSKDEFKLEYGKSLLQKNQGFIDCETWRDAHNSVFWGFELHYRDVSDREMKITGATITGVDEEGRAIYEAKPDSWNWSRCSLHEKEARKKVMTECSECERQRPKNYGKAYTVGSGEITVIKGWCWHDEVVEVLTPLLIENNINRVYAHNSTFDIVPLLNSYFPQYDHPLQAFVEQDPEARSRILMTGSKILSGKMDIAPHYNDLTDSVYEVEKWSYKDKAMRTTNEFMLEVRDSARLFPLSLKDIGRAICKHDFNTYVKTEDGEMECPHSDCGKGETPAKFCKADHPDFGNVMSITDEDILYCIKDCEVLAKGIFFFYDGCKQLGYHGKDLTLTIGTMAQQIIAHHDTQKLWAKKKNSWKYRTLVNDTELDDIARGGLVGGMTRCMSTLIHTEEAQGDDARALYPSVMNTNDKWPDFRRLKGLTEFGEGELEKCLRILEGVIHVNWKKPSSEPIGIIAQKNEENLLDWELDEGTRWITFVEYRFASQYGYEFEPVVDEESGYVAIVCPRLKKNPHKILQDWYNLRAKYRAENNPFQLIIKLLMNAGGYGKYVERNKLSMITSEEAWMMEFPDEWNFTGVHVDSFGGWGFATAEEYHRADGTANIMGCYITAYARKSLYEYGREIIRQGGELLYCDTDSFKYLTNGVVDMSHRWGKKLGEWANEQTYDFWHSVRPKQYKYHAIVDEGKPVDKWQARIKGCSLGKAAELAGVNYRDYCRDLDLHGTVTFERLIGIKESAKRGMKAGTFIEVSKSIGKLAIEEKVAIDDEGVGA